VEEIRIFLEEEVNKRTQKRKEERKVKRTV